MVGIMYKFRELLDDKTVTDVVTNIESVRTDIEEDGTYSLFIQNKLGIEWTFCIKDKEFLYRIISCIANENYIAFNALNLLGYDMDNLDLEDNEVDAFYEYADNLCLETNKE